MDIECERGKLMKTKVMANDESIPTIDLSPFFKQSDDEQQKNKAIAGIKQACSTYGFFQIVNHGVPLDLINQSLHLSEAFFSLSDDEKLKSKPNLTAPLPAGYSKQPPHSPDKNEYLLVFPPDSAFNVYPANPPGFREVIEEIFYCLRKTGALMESILNECMNLPPGFLKEYNNDRSHDFMVALRYFPGAENEDTGLTEHEDGNCVTLVLQDQVGGLEVCRDGQWIPVTPSTDSIVVNVGDVIQVLSNKKMKSAQHRVVRAQGKSRHSYAFFYNLEGETWVEPLPQFTTEIGEQPLYRGFKYKDYQALRMRNKTHPPSNPHDAITINHYAINSP
nr:flavonol synthase [Euphorbia maculata]